MFQRIWTPEMIKEYIISSNGKEPLNSHYYSTNHPSIYAAAERIFGSWGNAINAAGLDYNAIRKYKIWTRMRIVQTIRKKSKAGEQLSSQYIQNNCKSLYMAAVHHFKSWGQAIKASGLDYNKIRMRRSMTEEQIRAEIIRLYKSGEDMAYSNIRKNACLRHEEARRRKLGGSAPRMWNHGELPSSERETPSFQDQDEKMLAARLVLSKG